MGLRPIYIGRYYPSNGPLYSVYKTKKMDVVNSAAFLVEAYLRWQTLSADRLIRIVLKTESEAEIEKPPLAHILS